MKNAQDDHQSRSWTKVLFGDALIRTALARNASCDVDESTASRCDKKLLTRGFFVQPASRHYVGSKRAEGMPSYKVIEDSYGRFSTNIADILAGI